MCIQSWPGGLNVPRGWSADRLLAIKKISYKVVHVDRKFTSGRTLKETGKVRCFQSRIAFVSVVESLRDCRLTLITAI